jgi:hypothetical protein
MPQRDRNLFILLGLARHLLAPILEALELQSQVDLKKAAYDPHIRHG